MSGPGGPGRGPFRLTTRGDRQWTRLVPWVVVVPLVGVCAYLLVSGPLTATTIVPVVGILLAALIASSGAIVSLTPAAQAWNRRSALLSESAVVIARPRRAPFEMPFTAIDRIHTHPETTGFRIPPAVQLVTDFYGIDGRRIPELAVHHASYRYAYRATDVNADGPAFLRALAATPLPLDAASEALVELVFDIEAGGLDGVPDAVARKARAGRLWHAMRAAEKEARDTERTSAALVRLSLVLAHDAVETARAGLADHPGRPVFAWYLANALLADVGVSEHPGPVALQHRAELRSEARVLLEGLLDDEAYGARAAALLARLGPARGEAV